MNFPTYFKRRVGAAPASVPVLGSATDPAPTFANPTSPGPGKTNNCSVSVGGIGNPIHRLAVGYHYEGGGTGIDLTADVWTYDTETSKWFKCSTGTLKNGEITYFRVPYLMPPPQTSLTKPTSGGATYQIVIADPGGTSDGVYHFVAGPDVGSF